MLELTQSQCDELHRRVYEKLKDAFKDTPHEAMIAASSNIASAAAIITIREYEAMKQQPELPQK